MTYPIDKLVKKVTVRCGFMLVVTLVLMLTSCDHTFFVNGSFPENVFLSADGGSKSIWGTMNDAPDVWAEGVQEPCTCDTVNGNSVVVRCGWLKVEYTPKTGEMVIVAEPNSSRKRRRAIISGMDLDTGVDIRVYQGKK